MNTPNSNLKEILLKRLRSYEGTRQKTDYKLVMVKEVPQNPTFNAADFENIIDNFVLRSKLKLK
jgi:hypothetical protein